MTKKAMVALLFLTASAGVLTRSALIGNEAAAQSSRTGDPNAIEAGRRHFEAHCAACHGADGKGGERGPDVISTESARRRSAEDLGELIRKGIPAAGSAILAFGLPQ